MNLTTEDPRTTDELIREYRSLARARFNRVFGANAAREQARIGAILLHRGITHIPNIFGAIAVSDEY